MPMSDDCLFCNIAEGNQDADTVYRGENVVAFHDINPQAPTHILICPREHIPTIDDLEQHHTELMGKLVQRARQIARDEHIHEDGYRLVFNCKRGAGQSVFHIHLHLLGGREFSWPPG